jgi:hypothetical protein
MPTTRIRARKPAQVALADAILAVCGAIVSLLFVGGSLDSEKIKGAWHHSHRALA